MQDKKRTHLWLKINNNKIKKNQPEGNTSMLAEDMAADERSPVDYTTPLASSPPMRKRNFRELGESSRGAQGNNEIMDMLMSM